MYPRLDGLAAEFLRGDVADGLGEVPTVPTQVLDGVVALAVLTIDGPVEHTCAEVPSTLVVNIDAIYAHANQMGHAAGLGWKLLAAHVADDHGAIGPDAQLCTM